MGMTRRGSSVVVMVMVMATEFDMNRVVVPVQDGMGWRAGRLMVMMVMIMVMVLVVF